MIKKMPYKTPIVQCASCSIELVFLGSCDSTTQHERNMTFQLWDDDANSSTLENYHFSSSNIFQ